MLVGAAWLALAGLAIGELPQLATMPFHAHLTAGWLYLTVVGSLAGYTAYVYLLKFSTPARVSTYAYVNPAVAVFVGWAFGGETVTGRILFAATLLLGGVALITARKRAS